MAIKILPSDPKKKRNTLISLFVGLVTLTAFILYLLAPNHIQSTNDAYVAGQQVVITSQLSGTIDAIYANNTQRVEQGTKLLRLNPNKLLLEQQSTEANLKNIIRQVQSNYLKMDQLKAQIQAETMTFEQTKQDYQRRIGGDKDGSVLPEVLAHAKNAVSISKQNLGAFNKQLQATKALLPQEGLLDNPQVQTALAKLRQVYLAQENTTIIAPKEGMVAERLIQVGQQIQPGQALMIIVPLNELWIEANFKETQLTDIKPGQAVTLTSDLYGDKYQYTGIIAGIGAGTGSAFSAIPAQNATGNWIKIVQRVPVRIHIDSPQLRNHPLRIGMSMNVSVDTQATAAQVSSTSIFPQDDSLINVSEQRLKRVNSRIQMFVDNNIK